MEVCRTWPSSYLLLRIHPALYLLDFLDKVLCDKLCFYSYSCKLILIYSYEFFTVLSIPHLIQTEATQLDASFSQSHSNSRTSQIGLRASDWPPLAHLSASHLSLNSLALLDAADSLVLFVGSRLRTPLAQLIFGTVQAPTQAQLEQMVRSQLC